MQRSKRFPPNATGNRSDSATELLQLSDLTPFKEICDFFPIDGRLSPFVKLPKHPIVGRLNFWIFFTEFPVKMLARDKDQTSNSPSPWSRRLPVGDR